MDGESDYINFLGELNAKIRYLEEKQRVLKDRILLVGKNLIEFREKTNEEFLEIKKTLEIIKEDNKKMIIFLESASQEFSKYARKEDLEILSKQAKMFQPLEFVKKEEIKDLLNKKT